MMGQHYEGDMQECQYFVSGGGRQNLPHEWVDYFAMSTNWLKEEGLLEERYECLGVCNNTSYKVWEWILIKM